MRGGLQRVKMRGFWRGRPGLPRSGESPNAIPAFAIAAHAAILAPMPTLEINATQPLLPKLLSGEITSPETDPL